MTYVYEAAQVHVRSYVPWTIELSGSDTELDLGQNTELDKGAQELDNEVYTCQLP